MTIMTKNLSVAQAKSHLSEVLHQVRESGDRFIIENRGRPVAAIVPLTDLPPAESAEGDWMLDFVASLGEEREQLADILDEVYAERQQRMPRPVNLFDDDEPEAPAPKRRKAHAAA